MLFAALLAIPFLALAGAGDTDVLVSHSLCGLVNRVNGTLFHEFAIETQTRNYYHDDPDYALFVKARGDDTVLNLDYCGFAVGGDSLQIDVLCDELMECVCTTYFHGKKCSNCVMDIEDKNSELGFPFPVNSVHADCSGISEASPNCLVLPDGPDEDNYPDVQECFDLSTLLIPTGSSRAIESGGNVRGFIWTLAGVFVVAVPTLLA